MSGHAQSVTLESLPQTHRGLRGLYGGEHEGVRFQLYVNDGQRRASGHEIAKAQINAMSRGRPLSNSDLYVQNTEIYLLIGNQHRKDVRINPNGSYAHGPVVGRTLREFVASMLRAYGPRPKGDPSAESEASSVSPKPF